MTDTVQYGDPGLTDWWKDRVQGAGQVSWDPWQYWARSRAAQGPHPVWDNAPDAGDGGTLDWLAGQGIVTGGSAYNPSTGLYPGSPHVNPNALSWGLPQPQVTTLTGAQSYAPSVYEPATAANQIPPGGYLGPPPGVAYNPAGNYPAAAYAARHGTGIGYQPPGEAPEGSGKTYPETTQGKIEWLKDNTGRFGGIETVKNKEGVEYDVMVRKDAYGNVVSFTPVSGRTAELANKWHSVGRGPSANTEMRRHGGSSWKKKSQKSSAGTGSSAGSEYPSWVVNMSKWRGI